MDNMDNNNDLNESTIPTKESTLEGFQVVKAAIEAHRRFQHAHTRRDMEAAINEFDIQGFLQGSNELVQDWMLEADTIDELLHRLEISPEEQKAITIDALSRVIEYNSGKNEGKNQASIRTRQGKANHLLSKASEDDTPGIVAELNAKLTSAREDIETGKVRMTELKHKRIELTERHNENVKEYRGKAEKYQGLGPKFHAETESMNEQNQLHIIEVNLETENLESEIEECDRELARITEKKAQLTQQVQSIQAEAQKEVKDSVARLSRQQALEKGNVENELIGALRKVKTSRRHVVDNTIAVEATLHRLHNRVEYYNDNVAESHALTPMDCGALAKNDSHLVVAQMSAKEIRGHIPSNDLIRLKSMSRDTKAKYFTSMKNLGLYKNEEFYAYGEVNELAKQKFHETNAEMQIRVVKVSTVSGDIASLDGNVLEAYRDIIQAEEIKKKRGREDSEISGSSFLCVPSPLNENILKMSSLTYDGSTPSAKKKRRRLSHIGSQNSASHGPVLSQYQVFTPDKPLYLNQSQVFTPDKPRFASPRISLSQASFGDVSVSNLKDPKNYE